MKDLLYMMRRIDKYLDAKAITMNDVHQCGLQPQSKAHVDIKTILWKYRGEK